MAEDKKGPRVTTRLNDNPLFKERLPVYLPILETFARSFDLSIVLNTPLAPLRPHTKSRDTIYLYLGSYPKNPVINVNEIYPKIICGYRTPDKFSMTQVDLDIFGLNSKWAPIHSPEGLRIGYFCHNNIWIYPGVLNWKLWKNDEDLHILKTILYIYLPEAVVLGSDIRLHNQTFVEGYNILRSEFKKDLRKVEINAAISNGIKDYITYTSVTLLEDLNSQIGALMREAEELSRSDHGVSKQIVELENKIETAEHIVADRDFGEEFERILKIDKIQCLRVVTLEDSQYIIVFTDRIDQIPNSLSEARYDIGSWEIVIDSSQSTHAGVVFFQCRRKGRYAHYFATLGSNGVCFGSSLNQAMDKVFSLFDMAPLIHLIVSFLIKESSAPQPRDPKTNQSITSTPPLGLDYYSTDKDRQEEKNRFIDLMRKKVWTSLIAATKAELEKAEQALGKIRAERAKLRVSILQKEFELRSLENEFSKTGDLSSSQADRVINNEYVFWVSADEDEILIYFYSPHLKNDRYFRNARGFVLRISRGRHSELCDFFKFPKELSSDSLPKHVSTDIEHSLIRSELSGNIADILSITQELISRGITKS